MEKRRFDTRLFNSPPTDCYPNYAWVWNTDIDRETVREQLYDFHENGVMGIYILPMPAKFRDGVGQRTFFEMPYPGEEFFSLAAYAADIAKSLGMVMWIYDEGGWPSGGACGRVLELYPGAVSKAIARADIDETKGIPHDRILSMFDGGGKRVFDDKKARYIYFVKEFYHKNFVNLLDRKTTDTFIECTYDGYKRYLGHHYGKTVKLIFTDEPRLRFPAWTEGLDNLFAEKYGYDMLDFLPCICGDIECCDEDSRRARIDYSRLCAELNDKNLHSPIKKYCRESGILFGGHLDGEHTPINNVRGGHNCLTTSLLSMDAPGVDTIWRQIFPNADGSSVSDEVTTTFFPRYASSAAHIGGKDIALSETFSVYGMGMTPEDMRFVINYQLASGINCMNFMSLTSGRDRALMYAMRPNFLPQKPGWDGNVAVGLETARLCYILRIGESDVHAALYFPKDDIAAGGDVEKAATREFDSLGKSLEDSHIEFDIIGDSEIENAELCGGGLKIGKAEYGVIYVPECRYMPEATRKKLEKANVKHKVTGCGDYCGKVRFLTRILGEEKIMFVFNEGTETQNYIPKAEEGMNIYLLDPSYGFAVKVTEDYVGTLLPRGKTVAYLYTAKDYPARTVPSSPTALFRNPEVTSARRFVIEDGRIHYEAADIAEFRLDKASGSVTLAFKYSLPRNLSGDIAILEADIPDYSVGVAVDGKRLGAMSAYPRRLCVPMSELSESGTVELTIENTEACEIVQKSDELLRDFGDVISVYHEGKFTPQGNSLSFEKEYAARLHALGLPTGIELKITVIE